MDSNPMNGTQENVGGCGCAGGQQGGGKKRPLSEYNKFMKAHFKKLREKHPSKTAPELLKMIAKMWKESRPVKSASKPVKAKKAKKTGKAKKAKK
jgi:hypothetical protein